MNKNITILLVCIAITLLSACSVVHSRMSFVDDSHKNADMRLEQILNALSSNDKDTLKSMFSKRALSEANDFDFNMDCLFEYFQGTITSWEREGGSPSMYMNNGEKSIETSIWGTVVTDKDIFLFSIKDYYIDTLDPDNEGLYALHLAKTEDANVDDGFIYGQDLDIPGIYVHQ